jgi:hypothetical protein
LVIKPAFVVGAGLWAPQTPVMRAASRAGRSHLTTETLEDPHSQQ